MACKDVSYAELPLILPANLHVAVSARSWQYTPASFSVALSFAFDLSQKCDCMVLLE